MQRQKVVAAFDREIAPDELKSLLFQPLRFSIETTVIYRDPHSQGARRIGLFVGNDPINFVDPLGLWSVEVYGGAGLAGFASFGYNSGHFSWRLGIGAGDGVSASWDGRNKATEGGLAEGAHEGGLIGRLDLGAGVAGVGVGGEISGASDKCGKSQATAKIGGSASFLAYQKAGEIAEQTNPNTGEWERVPDSSTQIAKPDGGVFKGEFVPKKIAVGGFFGVFFGRQ